ncbi:hypothetical protein ACLKA7_007722 [Drosophila subpalustris]
MVPMPADPTKTATPEMVTMPAGQAIGAGPSKPVFHPGLGVEGVILPPPITSELRQSAKSAAVPPAGARTVSVAPTAGAKKKFSFTERKSAGDILQRNHNCAVPNLSAEWLRKVACDDNRSAELYKVAVASVGEVYAGAKLEAVNWEEVPAAALKDVEEAVIILNKESLAPIDAAGGELNFGFSSVFIGVYKSDAAVGGAPSGKPAEEDITAELEAPGNGRLYF